MEKFKILGYAEEKRLSAAELHTYYQNLKKFLEVENFGLIKQGYLNFCKRLNKKIVRAIIDKQKGYPLTVIGRENIPASPVIYASSHQDYNDHFNIVLSVPEHAVILNTSNVTIKFKLLLSANGIVWVDRNSAESRFNAKIELMHYLAKDKSVLMFPEGTFNCSPNKLHLPFHKGIIDIAGKIQVPIIPLIQEYVYNGNDATIKNVVSCTVQFGKPVYVRYDDDKDEKLEELSAAFSTIRFGLTEKKGIFNRDEISNTEYINYVLSRIDGWAKTKVSIDDERATIYGASDDFYLFNHINDVAFQGNELLETEEVRRLNRMIDTHIKGIYFDSPPVAPGDKSDGRKMQKDTAGLLPMK